MYSLIKCAHHVFYRPRLDINAPGFGYAVPKLLLVLGQAAVLGLDLNPVENTVLDGDTVGNALGCAEALQYWKMKNALEVEVIADLGFYGGFWGHLQREVL